MEPPVPERRHAGAPQPRGARARAVHGLRRGDAQQPALADREDLAQALEALVAHHAVERGVEPQAVVVDPALDRGRAIQDEAHRRRADALHADEKVRGGPRRRRHAQDPADPLAVEGVFRHGGGRALPPREETVGETGGARGEGGPELRDLGQTDAGADDPEEGPRPRRSLGLEHLPRAQHDGGGGAGRPAARDAYLLGAGAQGREHGQPPGAQAGVRRLPRHRREGVPQGLGR